MSVEFRELVRRLRGKRTQAQIAAGLGVVPSAVANWESGIQQPRRAMLPLMASVLGCDVALLERALLAHAPAPVPAPEQPRREVDAA